MTTNQHIIEAAIKVGFKITGDDFGNSVLIYPYTNAAFDGVLTKFAELLTQPLRQELARLNDENEALIGKSVEDNRGLRKASRELIEQLAETQMQLKDAKEKIEELENLILEFSERINE